MTQIEQWRPLPRFHRYEVSDQGRIRNVETGCVRKLSKQPNGMLFISLKRDGKSWNVEVHRAVAEAFIGPRPEGMETCHRNGNSQDNRATNLRYDTHRNNEADKVQHGTLNIGERNGRARLTEQEVRRLRALGSARDALAARPDLPEGTVRGAFTGRTWAHLPMPSRSPN